jgi:hypothetical protein
MAERACCHCHYGVGRKVDIDEVGIGATYRSGYRKISPPEGTWC